MDAVGGDVVRGFFIDLLNANHAGGTLYGLDIDGIVGDPQATETAINIGAGWDVGLQLDDGSATDDNITFGAGGDAQMFWQDAGAQLVIDTDATAAAGLDLYVNATSTSNILASGGVSDIIYDPLNAVDAGFVYLALNILAVNATNGNDIITVLEIDWNETDWATATETLNGINIDAIAQDAQGTYNAINIGDGWDYAITVPDGGAADNAIGLGDTPAADAEIYWNGGALVLDIAGTATSDFSVEMGQNNAAFFRVQNVGGTSLFRWIPINVANAGYDGFEIEVGGIFATDGNDIVNMLLLDWNETDWATATETWNAINIDDITQDAQGLYYGVHVGTGIDAAFYSEGVAHAALAAVANGSIVFCTDCDPASTPCTSAGAQTGAFAFRVNGAWDCPW
jgi:hypothetical protein